MDDRLATPDWYPLSLDREHNITFVQMTRDTFRQSAFHHEAIIRAGDRTMKVPIGELAGRKSGVPSHFILHTTYCGSTLLTRYLEDLQCCFVLREPRLLTQLGFLPYSNSWLAWFTTSLSLLGRAYPSDVATIIKLHDFCNWMGGPILDLEPRIRIVFTYNPLRTHLLQILKNERRRLVRKHVQGYPTALLPALAEAVAGELSEAQWAATTWLLNAHLCSQLLARPDAERVLVIKGRDAISDPQHSMLAIAEHFGIANDETRVALAELRPATRHAKDGWRAYDDASLATDLASAERTYGEEVEAGFAWARQLCPELIEVFDGAVRFKTAAAQRSVRAVCDTPVEVPRAD